MRKRERERASNLPSSGLVGRARETSASVKSLASIELPGMVRRTALSVTGDSSKEFENKIGLPVDERERESE